MGEEGLGSLGLQHWSVEEQQGCWEDLGCTVGGYGEAACCWTGPGADCLTSHSSYPHLSFRTSELAVNGLTGLLHFQSFLTGFLGSESCLSCSCLQSHSEGFLLLMGFTCLKSMI